MQDRHSTQTFFVECINSVLLVTFRSSTVLDNFLYDFNKCACSDLKLILYSNMKDFILLMCRDGQSKLICVLSLFHSHTHKYANYSTYWFPSSMYLHNWLIHVHAICSSTNMYMKNENDVTGWLSQTTDISKYFIWSPGLWDKESCLYEISHEIMALRKLILQMRICAAIQWG